MPKICAGEPAEFEAAEIDKFVLFVVAGGEVNREGLKGRVVQARCIAFLREKGSLVAVGGLKNPSAAYRRRVSSGSRTQLDDASFPFELGWVFVHPDARGRGYSLPLCESLISGARGHGVFATSNVGNPKMHKTLAHLGFARTGAEWQSQQTEGNLALFLKHEMKAMRPALDRAKPPIRGNETGQGKKKKRAPRREDNDEAYIVSLCDAVLGRVALRQYNKFDFLRGDLGKHGRRHPLPVDGYYPDLQLVVEFNESQHAQPHAFFDKPQQLTVSGVHRGAQRALYDERRRVELPKNGIALVEFSLFDFAHDSNGFVVRDRLKDLDVVRHKLRSWLPRSRGE